MIPFIFFPWIINYPLSGDVYQKFQSILDQFFNEIPSDVGTSYKEKEIFTKISSYGDQLGIIIDALCEIVEKNDKKFDKLINLKQKIDAIREK